MKKSMLLTTARLTLEPFAHSDTELLYDTFNNQFIRKFLWDDKQTPYEVIHDIVETNARQFEKEGSGLWKILDKGNKKYFGFCGLWYFFDQPEPQLLYGLLPAHTSKGYATEASDAVVKYAIDGLHFENLIASFDEGNTDSRNVCTRLGLVFDHEEIIDGKRILFYKLPKLTIL